MSAIEVDVVFDMATRTRAAYKTSVGDFVCARMKINGDIPHPDSIILRGVGRTPSAERAQMWIDLGIEPENRY